MALHLLWPKSVGHPILTKFVGHPLCSFFRVYRYVMEFRSFGPGSQYLNFVADAYQKSKDYQRDALLLCQANASDESQCDWKRRKIGVGRTSIS